MNKLKITIMSLLMALVACFGLTWSLYAVGTDQGTGSITITNGQGGVDYAAYQIFSANYSDGTTPGQTKGVSYFADQDTVSFFENLSENGESVNPFVFTPLSDGTYAVSIREGYPSDVIAQFFNHFQDQIETQFASRKHEPTSTSGSLVQFDALPYGYYFLTSSSGSLVTLTTAAPSAQVIEKTQSPVIDEGAKKVQSGQDWVNWSGTTVGDVRNFQIQFSASNYVNETLIPSYTITDRNTNLDIDESSVVLMIGNQSIAQSDFASKGITFSSTDSTMTIEIPWVDENNTPLYQPSPTDVKLTYSATVLPAAAKNGASNTVKITYNDQDVLSSVNLATYSFQLNKYDKASADSGSPVSLNGAQFTLWDAAENGNRIYVTLDENGGYDVLGSSSSVANSTLIEAGMTHIYGLNEGTYYLQEEKAPDGYTILSQRVPVTVQKPASGQGNNVVAVLNAKGSMLPSTGESGNFIFYAGALSLAALAFVLLLYLRKTGEKN